MHGANGAHALKRVALDHSTAIVPVPTPLQHTEGNSVPEREQRRGTATQNNAQVLSVLRCCFGTRSGMLSDSLPSVVASRKSSVVGMFLSEGSKKNLIAKTEYLAVIVQLSAEKPQFVFGLLTPNNTKNDSKLEAKT